MLNIVPQFLLTAPIFLQKLPKQRRQHRTSPAWKIQQSTMNSWKVKPYVAFKSSPPFNIFELSVHCPMTRVMIAFSMLTEEMISGLQRLGWKKVDVSFHSAFWPFFAHNNIHVLTPFLFWVMITLLCWFTSWFNFFFFSHFRWKMNGFIMLALGWSLMLQTA